MGVSSGTLLSGLMAGRVLVADGAMGTMLMARGLAPGGCPEAFALDHPGVLEEIARLYLEAGADVIQTDTFGGHPAKLASYGLADRAAEINTRAVQAARGAVDSHAGKRSGPIRPAGGRPAPG